ncbi:hypothetical protein [Nostoc sp. 106C]|uniref:hypothetical protein n=1 Tax=Nostoc sp. 106C TaxID=1932667 RepID=UPI00117FE061|nr:hypothetical protein [Nostoc sp. 106C]
MTKIDLSLAKVTFARGGKGKRLKGKGFLLALSPLPLTLFPTSAKSLMEHLDEQNSYSQILKTTG